jgi:hypothetical protein
MATEQMGFGQVKEKYGEAVALKILNDGVKRHESREKRKDSRKEERAEFKIWMEERKAKKAGAKK